MLEDVHVSISALLRSSTGLLMSVQEFIVGYVAFDCPAPTNVEDVESLWSFLDVAPSHLDLCVRVTPMWDGRRLRVSAALQSDVGAIQAVTPCIKSCMHWVDFSETRRTKVGQCGRLFLRSMFVGIENVAQLASHNDVLFKWHLNGFCRKSPGPVRMYLAIVAEQQQAGHRRACSLSS